MLALQSTDFIYKSTDVQHHQWLIRWLLSKSAGGLLLICCSVYSLKTELLMVSPLYLLVVQRHCKLLALLLGYAPHSLGLLNENVKTCVFTIKPTSLISQWTGSFQLLMDFWTATDATTGDFAISVAEVWKKWGASWQKVTVICSVVETYYTANSHGIQTDHELHCIWLWEGCRCCLRDSRPAARGPSWRGASQHKWASDCDEKGTDVPEVMVATTSQ